MVYSSRSLAQVIDGTLSLALCLQGVWGVSIICVSSPGDRWHLRCRAWKQCLKPLLTLPIWIARHLCGLVCSPVCLLGYRHCAGLFVRQSVCSVTDNVPSMSRTVRFTGVFGDGGGTLSRIRLDLLTLIPLVAVCSEQVLRETTVLVQRNYVTRLRFFNQRFNEL